MCMTHPLNIPYMVENVLLEGKGWSSDHLSRLPLALILAHNLEVERPEVYDGCSGIVYFI